MSGKEQFSLKISDMVLSHRNVWLSILLPAIAVFISLVILTAILLITAISPLETYAAMIRGSMGSLFALASTLRWSTPLILSGLAIVIGFKAGLFNAGVEGQLYVGGFVATWVGFFNLPGAVHPLIAILLGGVAGALWALGPALLKAYYDASEIVTTLMLNYVAMGLTDFLTREFYKDPRAAAFLMTVPIEKSAELNSIFPIGNVSVVIFFALISIPLMAYLFRKSKLGYEITVSGLNMPFAIYGGVSARKTIIMAMMMSGFVGGIIGSAECLGINGRFVSNFSPGYGFDGFLVALIGGTSFMGVLPAGIFMGILKAGSLEVERALSVGKAMIWVFQGCIIGLVSAHGIARFLSLKKE
jgi:general nucleoside transport system permease protein